MTPSRRRMTPLRRRMMDDMTLRNLAPRTIESYVQRISGFAQYFKTSPEHLGPDHVRPYLLHLVHERGLSWSHFNQVRSALRFLYSATLKQDWVMQDIVCAKKPHTLPVVLSLDELTRFFAAITNLKHRAILRLRCLCSLAPPKDYDACALLLLSGQSLFGCNSSGSLIVRQLSVQAAP